MKAIRRWLRILTRPFPDDAVYVPRLLRCHTPLSVIVFLLLLGGLIFLPRNELFRQDVAVTKGHLDLWHFLFFALACAGFWLLAIGFRLLVRRFGKRQSDRWGFHAIQCIAIGVLMTCIYLFSTPWNDVDLSEVTLRPPASGVVQLGRSYYSPQRWDRTHIYTPVAVVFSLVAWSAMGFRRRLYRYFGNKRRVVRDTLKIIDEMLDSPVSASPSLPPCRAFATGTPIRQRLVDAFAWSMTLFMRISYVVLRWGFALLTFIAIAILVALVLVQAYGASGLPWGEFAQRKLLDMTGLRLICAGIVLLVLVGCVVGLYRDERRLVRFLDAWASSVARNGAFIASAALIAVMGVTVYDVKYVSTVVMGSPQLVLKWFALAYLLIWNFQYLIQSALDLRLMDVFQKYERRSVRGAEEVAFAAGPAVSETTGSVVEVNQVRLASPATAFSGIERYGISGFQRAIPPDATKQTERTQIERTASADSIESFAIPTQETLPSTPSADETLGRVVGRNEIFDAMLGHPTTRLAGEIFKRDSDRFLATVNLSLMLALFALFTAAGFTIGKRRLPIVYVDVQGTENQQPTRPHKDAESLLISNYRIHANQDNEPTSSADPTASARLLEDVCGLRKTNIDDRTIIVLAASGGGTRAALYTASVLERLHRMGRLEQVRIVGGASGGCVALGYFLYHYESLIGSDPEPANPDNAWSKFYSAMQSDFIVDSIRGLTQIRTVAGQPIGVQLAESFARAWGDETPAGKLMRQMSDVPAGPNQPAFVIINSLAGVSPSYSRPPLSSASNGAATLNQYGNADSFHGGGRLLWTNFDVSPEWFPGYKVDGNSNAGLPLKSWRYDVITRAKVELPRLLALSANFPPVFQNAGIVVNVKGDPARVYWVTDGGTVDNRGALPLMYVVEGAMRDYLADRPRTALQSATLAEDSSTKPKTQRILFVVADASRAGNKYAHDNGQSVFSAAGTELANQLIQEKLAEIQDLAQATDIKFEVNYHYVPMPYVLRYDDAGRGFGTHWMPDWSLTIPALKNDAVSSAAANESITLGRQQLIELMKLMALPNEVDYQQQDWADTDAKNALQILRANDAVWKSYEVRSVNNQSAWERLVKALSD